jgi:hypothetical protein
LNLSAYEIALIAGGFTIIGALLGAWIGYRNALKLHSIVEFNKAATEFRNAFLHELIFLRHNASTPEGERNYTTLNEFLQDGYIHRHLRAFEIFKNYLSPSERVNIAKAWKEYCCHPDSPSIPFFEQYSWKVANRGKDYEKQLKVLALNRIENILKFAKPK